MCYYIGIEELAANALIEILKSKSDDLDKYTVSFAKLEEYGTKIVEKLRNNGNEKAVLIFSRESTTLMFNNYNDYFELKETSEGSAISLKKGKTVSDLIKQFRTYMSLDVMRACMDKTVVEVLEIA